MSPLTLITGGAGGVAAGLASALGPTRRLRLADTRRPERVRTTDDVVVGDLLDPAVMDAAVDGVESIVHLAGNPSPRSTWADVEAANVRLTHDLFESAHRAGVANVVVASSVHAAGAYVAAGESAIDPGWPARPCCLYGASKAAAEALGAYYAAQYDMRVTCLRLGAVLAEPKEPSVWLSPRDLVSLVDRALTADVGYGIYFGVSDNAASLWRVDNARRDLGYAPLDDSEHWSSAQPVPMPEAHTLHRTSAAPG